MTQAMHAAVPGDSKPGADSAARVFVPPKVESLVNGSGVLRFMRAMIRNPVAAVPKAAYTEQVVKSRVGGTVLGTVCGTELLEEVLIRRVADFPKSKVDERLLRPAFGDSLLTAHGEDWRWKRRLAAPYFAPSALARSLSGMVAPFAELVGTWQARNNDAPVDVAEAMTAATFDVISRVLFSDQDAIDFARLSRAIDDYLAPSAWVTALASLNVPEWVPHPGSRQIKRSRDRMRALVGDSLSARRTSSRVYEDICSDLMHATDPESGRPLSDEDLIDMLLTLIAAGHETSANALAWALFCLAEQPLLQEELKREVASAIGDREVSAGDLPSLVLVDAFLKETMRLFPPAPLLARRATKRETFGDETFEPGTILFIPVYAIQRHEDLWEEPDRFDLHRFTGAKAKSIPRTAYMPFGAGPRICVGGTFAMMEMVAGLATMLQGVNFEAVSGVTHEPVQRITLRPRGGMPLRVSARQGRLGGDKAVRGVV